MLLLKWLINVSVFPALCMWERTKIYGEHLGNKLTRDLLETLTTGTWSVKKAEVHEGPRWREGLDPKHRPQSRAEAVTTRHLIA